MIVAAVAAAGTSLHAGLIGSTGSTTLVLVVLLVALGAAMVVTAAWLVRSTRRDAPALGPLEVMGDRGFSKVPAEVRSETLSAVRPPGAPSPSPMIPDDEEPAADAVADEPAPEPVEDGVVEEPVEAPAVADPSPSPG